MEFNFSVDDDTHALLEITVHFLKTYFDYDENDAIPKLEEYYERAKHDDDFYHQISSFQVAARVHYFITLNGTENDYVFWRRENGLNGQPPEAAQYFREHYFLDDNE